MLREYLVGFSACLVVVATGTLACSSDDSGKGSGATPTPTAGPKGQGGTYTGGDGATVPVEPNPPGMGGPDVGTRVGQLATGPKTALPVLPMLTNVVATQRDDSVGIDFDPVDDAVDYRVYPLPDDGDITVNADGSVTVKNAIYRCAGLRQMFDVANNKNAGPGTTPQSSDGTGVFTYDGNGYAWKTQVLDNPTLGYVFMTTASDRVPVYAVAGPTLENEVGWNESRNKIYTTDSAQRQKLVDKGWRDDGIVFYVPSAASDATVTVYGSQNDAAQAGKSYTQVTNSYFLEADVSKHAKDSTPPAPAFQVLKAATSDTKPLMAVIYNPTEPHVELAAGKERYNRAANQGPGPLWHLEWAGITKPVTLVVEALSSGCPFQGFLAPTHLEAPPHQTFFTLADLQQKSPTGEVFINGQYDGPDSAPMESDVHGVPQHGPSPLLKASTMSPVAVARSFVQVEPHPHAGADWDWYEGFDVGKDFGPVTKMPRSGDLCPVSAQPNYCGRWQSPTFDFSAYNIDGDQVQVLSYGYFMGQLWEAFDDNGSDVTGKVRFTALQTANVDSDPNKFLHATMSVDVVSTDRRYPQLIISDQPAPVQEGMENPNGNTLLFQAIQGPATRIELQAIHGLVNGHGWDVNNQAKNHVFVRPDTSQNAEYIIAQDPAIDHHMGQDRMTRFDVYVSSNRVYFFLDGLPSGCSRYPSGFSIGGKVTVTVGDVLYHEGAADELVCYYQKPYPFLHEHQCTQTKRHFDDIGFKSGVPPPAWNEAIYPCGAY